MLRGAMRIVGRQVVPWKVDTSFSLRRSRLLRVCRIDTVVDVGAHVGTYGLELRSLGYIGKIISFEPVPESFERLCEASRHDSTWHCANLAVGDKSGVMPFKISQRRSSSSFLAMTPTHVRASPDSEGVSISDVGVVTLDGYVGPLIDENCRLWLKADVQGFERSVLNGANDLMPRVIGGEFELSYVPVYDGAPSADELISYLATLGLKLVGIQSVFSDDRSGVMLQADGVFVREGVVNRILEEQKS